MVLTRSYGASKCRTVRAVTATSWSLSQSDWAPSSLMRRRAVRISTNCGIRPSRHSSSVSNVANRSGNAAFFDPPTLTSPRNGTPPRTTILSIPLYLSDGRCLRNASVCHMLWHISIINGTSCPGVTPRSILSIARMLTRDYSNRLFLLLQNLPEEFVKISLLRNRSYRFCTLTTRSRPS